MLLLVNKIYWGVGETTIIPSKLSHTLPHIGPRAPRVSQTRKRARPAGLNLDRPIDPFAKDPENEDK